MKRLFKSMTVALVFTLVFTFLPFEKECRAISDKVLRIHILANSDSEYDQNLKLMVRDEILKFTEDLYKDVSSKEDAISLTQENLDKIITVAENTLKAKGCSKSVRGEICQTDFNTRYYGDVTMPSGSYTALRLIIGEGKGKNWWCVMYPSLCLYTSSDANSLEDELNSQQYEIITDTPKYEFRFKFLEYFDYFCNLLS